MDWAETIAYKTDLPLLRPHAHEIAAAFAFWTALQLVLSPILSAALSKSYVRLRLKPRQKRDWNIRVVAFVHAVYAVVAASYMLYDQEIYSTLHVNKLFGFNNRAGSLFAITTGYFLWDTMVSLIYLRENGPGFLIHAVLCCYVFVCSYKPFMQYYGVHFLLWELSSPFLNLHWFFDKCDLTGSKRQLINGVILLSTFFGVRLIYGNIISYDFFQVLSTPSAQALLPSHTPIVYKAALATLGGLNVFWFYKMVKSVTKRFGGESKGKRS